MSDLMLCEIVFELDCFIIGQKDVKCVVVVVLCNCWWWWQLGDDLCDEVYFKNILMIGLIGVGKIEISCCLVKLVCVFFLKVEVMKFIEVGYVGCDVEQIICDLVDVVIIEMCEWMCEEVKVCVYKQVEDCVVVVFVGDNVCEQIQQMFCDKLKWGELDDMVIDLEVQDNFSFFGMMEVFGQFGVMGGMDLLGLMKVFGGWCVWCKVIVVESYELLIVEEVDKLLDDEVVKVVVLESVQENGIVFIDEIDKVVVWIDVWGGDILCEGVQCDLLLLIEGIMVLMKYGLVKIDYILFIVSGVFYIVKFSDLLFELQGCLLIWVELCVLIEEDFICILIEMDNVLIW